MDHPLMPPTATTWHIDDLARVGAHSHAVITSKIVLIPNGTLPCTAVAITVATLWLNMRPDQQAFRSDTHQDTHLRQCGLCMSVKNFRSRLSGSTESISTIAGSSCVSR